MVMVTGDSDVSAVTKLVLDSPLCVVSTDGGCTINLILITITVLATTIKLS